MPRAQDLPFTCRQAYERIKASGMLPDARYAVYDLLFREGPLTQREIDQHLTPDAHKRVSELVKHGVVVSVGTRTCTVSGQEAYQWDVTDQLPVPIPKAKKEDLDGDAKAIAEIKAAIPLKKRSPELALLLERLDAEEAARNAAPNPAQLKLDDVWLYGD